MSGDTTIQILGIATGGAVAVIPIWSAAFPAQRIWLPQRYYGGLARRFPVRF